MTDKQALPPTGSPDRPAANSEYDLWFDGLLDEERSRRERARVSADPVQRARFEADRAIEASLRRGFAAQGPARALPGGRALPAAIGRAGPPWTRYAAAAVLLALLGAALAIRLARRDTDAGPALDVADTEPAPVGAQIVPPRPRSAQYSLGDVFLDALAMDFQPLLGCQAQDRWDAELFAQLADAPCNRDEGVVVLGEWIDPRLDVANVWMLRRGENPIMLIVPRCEQDTELCVSKDSGLYVHRGIRDGRSIYEISPVPGSEVLNCVEAKNVVTQQQF